MYAECTFHGRTSGRDHFLAFSVTRVTVVYRPLTWAGSAGSWIDNHPTARRQPHRSRKRRSIQSKPCWPDVTLAPIQSSRPDYSATVTPSGGRRPVRDAELRTGLPRDRTGYAHPALAFVCLPVRTRQRQRSTKHKSTAGPTGPRTRVRTTFIVKVLLPFPSCGCVWLWCVCKRRLPGR